MIEYLSLPRSFLTHPLKIAGIEFSFSILQIVLELMLPVIIYFVLASMLRRFLTRGLMRWKISAGWGEDTVTRLKLIGRRSTRILGGLIVAVLIGRLLGGEIAATIQEVGKILTQPIIESGSTRISIVTILLIIPVFFIAGRTGVVVKQYARTSFLVKLEPEKQSTIADLLRYLTAIMVTIVGISMLGINLGSLTVVFGVLGIGIGFGLQEVIANTFAGLVIILAHPIKEGDRVFVGSHEGNVVNIRLMNTVINTLTNETIIVPNSSLINKDVYNFSYDSPSIILVNQVQVSYHADLDQVLEVLRRIPDRNPYALRNMQHQAFVKSFDDSGITVELRTWIRTVYDKMVAHSWVNVEIWRDFKQAGVQIPFPQLDIHLPEKNGQ